jgi:predicted dehydrogenase
MTTTRVGYVGVDHHHRDPYLQLAERLPVEVVAVCEPGEAYSLADVTPHADRPDEVASEGVDIARVLDGATVYTEVETLLAEADVDALWVTYRNDAVPDIVDAAVDHGVDVLSEKPLARTAGDLEPVARRARAADVTVGATYFYRYNPVARALRERVREGFFGEVWSVDGRYVGSALDLRDTTHYVYDDAASRGGALQWIGLHWVDLFMYVLGEPIERVAARTATAPDADIDEGAVVQFETASGTMGTFQTGYYLDEPVKDTRFAVYGRAGRASSPVHHSRDGGDTVPLDLRSNRPAWRGAPHRRTEFELGYDRFPAWGDYVLAFFADFFAGREGGSVPADLDDALRVLRVLDAVYAAADGDGWVDVETPD